MSRPPARILTAAVEGERAHEPEPRTLPVPWWSLTKTALAAAALALVAGGALALDRPLPGKPFTLRQLLQHTAGVPNYGELAAYHDAVARGEPPWSEAELLTRVDADRLLFPPGEGWAYSNVGYLLVRRLIEQAAGAELDVALPRLLFVPLRVPGVRVAREPADLAGTAWGNAAGYHPGWVYHALLIGTPGEAARFLHRLMTERVLPAELLRAMCEPRPHWRRARERRRGLSLSRSRSAGDRVGLRPCGGPGGGRDGRARGLARPRVTGVSAAACPPHSRRRPRSGRPAATARG